MEKNRLEEENTYDLFSLKKTPETNLQLCQRLLKESHTADQTRLYQTLYSNYCKTLPHHIKLKKLEQSEKDEVEEEHVSKRIQFKFAEE